VADHQVLRDFARLARASLRDEHQPLDRATLRLTADYAEEVAAGLEAAGVTVAEAADLVEGSHAEAVAG
jgi:hypothetical protein